MTWDYRITQTMIYTPKYIEKFFRKMPHCVMDILGKLIILHLLRCISLQCADFSFILSIFLFFDTKVVTKFFFLLWFFISKTFGKLNKNRSNIIHRIKGNPFSSFLFCSFSWLGICVECERVMDAGSYYMGNFEW